MICARLSLTRKALDGPHVLKAPQSRVISQAMLARCTARLAFAVACLALACSTGAEAAVAPGALGDVIFGARPQDDRGAPPPLVARYVSDEGESFVLDRSAPIPLLKFEESQEVLALSPSPAARGDVIYRDDVGEPVLRATKLGGLILFARARPGGAPVALAGQASGLRLQAISASALLQKLGQASIRASRAARHLVVFDAQLGAQELTPDAAAVFGDAASVAAEAVVRIARRADGNSLLRRFGRILFHPGARSGARVAGGVMDLTVSPGQGLAGRPSSARIMAAAEVAR